MCKRMFLTFIVALFALVLVSCGSSKSDLDILIETAEAMNIELEVTESFELPVAFENEEIEVSWTSDNAAIFIVGGNQAVVSRGTHDVTVKLTATFSLGDATHAINISVVVKAQTSEGGVTVSFTVTLPAETPMGDDIYIAGDFGDGSNMPEWAPGNDAGKATRVDATTATFELTYDSITEPVTITYKWTRGSWDNVEKDIYGEEIGDRIEVITSDFPTVMIDNTVERWADINPDLTDAQKMSQAKEALNLPNDVFDDFPLPATGLHGVNVTWSSGNEDAITVDGSNAIISRTDNDVKVEMTATLKVGDLTDTKVIEVTVKSEDTQLNDSFSLTLTVALPSYTPVDDDIYIFGNFPENTGLSAWGEGANNPLNKLTRDGHTATITIEFSELTEVYELKYKFTRGSEDWSDVEGNADGGVLDDRIYLITRVLETHSIEQEVLSWEDLGKPLATDQERLDAAVNALSISLTVNENFTLPLVGLHDAVISWQSDNEVVEIDGGLATVTTDELDVVVTLTATVTVGTLSDSKTFDVTVTADEIIVEPNFILTLNVTLPSYTPNTDDIFVFGNFPASTGLSMWGGADNPLNKMVRTGNTATITINFYDYPEYNTLNFKFTRGDWDKVEGDEFGEYIENRYYTISGELETHAVDLVVLSWEDIEPSLTVVGNLEIITNFLMPEYGEDVTRTIRIWTPTDYDPESDKTYPVIYMQDGQNLFDAKTSFAGEWEVDETIMRMMDNELFDGAIVVGIDNSGANRINEYTPNWSDEPEAGGALYAQFIVETLKPYIDLNYNTKPEREHTMVAGSSMGGLISFYIGLEYTDVFGMVGAFSTSFENNTLEARQAFINALDTEGNLPRLIIDAGTGESLQTYVPIVVQELVDAGYPEALIHSEVHEGHGHNEASWRSRLEDALIWLFDLEPAV